MSTQSESSIEVISRKPRYVVQRCKGYEIRDDGSHGPLRETFYVMDLANNAKVVYRIDRNRARAERVCERLNRDYDHS